MNFWCGTSLRVLSWRSLLKVEVSGRRWGKCLFMLTGCRSSMTWGMLLWVGGLAGAVLREGPHYLVDYAYVFVLRPLHHHYMVMVHQVGNYATGTACRLRFLTGNKVGCVSFMSSTIFSSISAMGGAGCTVLFKSMIYFFNISIKLLITFLCVLMSSVNMMTLSIMQSMYSWMLDGKSWSRSFIKEVKYAGETFRPWLNLLYWYVGEPGEAQQLVYCFLFSLKLIEWSTCFKSSMLKTRLECLPILCNTCFISGRCEFRYLKSTIRRYSVLWQALHCCVTFNEHDGW